MINKLSSEKGITGIDLTISLIIITLFISIITALSANVTTSLTSKKRLEIATNCMTDIMEMIDSIEYSKIAISENQDENKIMDIASGSFFDGTFESEIKEILQKDEYKILSVDIEKENCKPDGEEEDLLKKITVYVKYKVNNKEEVIKVTRLKPKYDIDLEEIYTN